MPKPINKTQLIQACKAEQVKLLSFIESIPLEKRQDDFINPGLNKNIRDVIGHLHHWHLLFLGWYDVGMKGEKPKMPTADHKWNQMPLLNQEIQRIYLDKSLNEVLKLQEDSYLKLLKIIETHTDAELFTKKKYTWTGSTSLAIYIILEDAQLAHILGPIL